MKVNVGDYVILKSIEGLEEEFENIEDIRILEVIKNFQNKPVQILLSYEGMICFEGSRGYSYPSVIIEKIVNPKDYPQYFI